MTDYEKAVRLLAAMARIHRPAMYLEVDDILSKCSSEELNHYYIWWCCGGVIITITQELKMED